MSVLFRGRRIASPTRADAVPEAVEDTHQPMRTYWRHLRAVQCMMAIALAILSVVLLAWLLYAIIRPLPLAQELSDLNQTEVVQSLVDAFARSITEQDWAGNVALFQTAGTVNMHRALTFLPTGSLALAAWKQQMEVYAGGFSSNHMQLTNCNSSIWKPPMSAPTHARVTCVAAYAYTLSFAITSNTTVLPTLLSHFQIHFEAQQGAHSTAPHFAGWRLTLAEALRNATTTLLSSVDTGVTPPGAITTKRRADEQSDRDISDDLLVWNTLQEQIAALIALNQVQTALGVCRTAQYIALAAEFDPHNSDPSLACNTLTLPPVYLDAPLVCRNTGLIDRSCLVGSTNGTGIQTVNSITPLPVTRDFTITGGLGIAIAGGMHGITINNVGLLVIALNAPFPFYFTKTISLVSPTITMNLNNTAANTVWAGPVSGGPAQPTFRALVLSDIPLIDLATHVTGVLSISNGGTGHVGAWLGDRIVVTAPGGTQLTEAPALSTGYFLLGDSGTLVPGTISPGPGINISLSGGVFTIAADVVITVTQVDLAVPTDIFQVTSAPILVNGTLTFVTLPQAANTVWAGPTSGGPVVPSFRALVASDLPPVSLSSGVSGTLPVGNGGTGNAGPYAGTSVIFSNLGGTALVEGTVLGTGGISVSLSGAGPTLTISGTGGTCTANDTISQSCLDISTLTCPNGALDATCMPSTLTLAALTVTGPAALGTSTTCAAPLAAPCYDISSQSCPGGYLNANCINPNLVLSSLTVTTLTATDILLLNGTVTVTGLSNFDAVNASTIYTNSIVLAGAMTCSPEDTISQNCYDISGISCTTPVSANCFPINMTFSDASVTNLLQVNNVACLGTPLGNDCIPERVRTINGISPSGAPTLDFTVAAGTGIAVTSITNGITVSNTGVTNVGLSLPLSVFSLSGTPVTTTGTLTATLVSQAANTVWAAPDGSSGAPAFRALAFSDLPVLGTEAIYYVDGAGNLTAASLSLALSVPSAEFAISGSPITSPTGTFTITKQTQTARTFWAGPTSGSPAQPAFRTIALSDLTALGLLDNELIVGVTGGAPVAATLVAGNNVNITYGSGTITLAVDNTFGTVTSVGLALPASVFSVTNSPITTVGTLTGSFVTQSANQFFAGPTSGGAATPAFRAMTYADLPALADGQLYIGITGGAPVATQLTAGALITVTPGPGTSTVSTTALGMVTLSMPGGLFSVGSSTGPNTQTLTVSLATQTANTVWAGPTTGPAAAPTFRALVAADVPNLDASKITTGVLPVARGGTNSGTALNNNRIMVSSGGAIVEAAALTNGQLLVGSTGAAPVAATLTGTTNQVNVAVGAGTITLSTPQNIHTAATPTFASMTLTATSNQLTLGTTNTITLSATAPAASRTYIISDAGANANFVMDTASALTITNAGSVGQVLKLATATTATWQTDTGTGTVTSVGLSLPVSVFSISGSPVTTSGTLTGSFTTQTANTVFAGPVSGGAATPTFRSLVTADLPVAVLLSYSEAADTTTISAFSNAAYTVVTSMTLTPVAGTYWCSFSTSVIPSTSSGVYLLALHLNGVIISHTVRRATGSSSYFNMHTLAVITTPGGQAIDVRWQKASGSGSADMRERSLYCLRIG